MQEKEVADLAELDRILMMDVPWQVEHVVRAVMQQEKIKVASFGNRVLPFEFLRGHSPSAEARGHGQEQEVLQTGKRNVEIAAIEPVGHYAIRIVFSDGHDSGIHSWDLLRSFCQNQPRLWDEYLDKLQTAGHPGESGRDVPMIESGGGGCAV